MIDRVEFTGSFVEVRHVVHANDTRCYSPSVIIVSMTSSQALAELFERLVS